MEPSRDTDEGLAAPVVVVGAGGKKKKGGSFCAGGWWRRAGEVEEGALRGTVAAGAGEGRREGWDRWRATLHR